VGGVTPSGESQVPIGSTAGGYSVLDSAQPGARNRRHLVLIGMHNRRQVVLIGYSVLESAQPGAHTRRELVLIGAHNRTR
jgi:hypothetical protein